MRISDWSSDVCSSDLIGNDLYRLFLDADMQYSCAYWPRPDMTLEEAQVAKKAHIAAKLALAPGQRVLDIGCGRSEEHTSELQSLMRISYAVFCLKKKKQAGYERDGSKLDIKRVVSDHTKVALPRLL